MAGKAAACTLEMGDTFTRGSIATFPVSRGGWGKMNEAAKDHAKETGHVAMVDLKCPGGRIPLYQCNRDYKDRRPYCVIETFSDPPDRPSPAIAGARGRRRRRR